MNSTPARNRFISLTLLVVLCYGISVSFVNGTFDCHRDYRSSTGDQLRVIRRPYTVGWIDYYWDCDLRLVKMYFAGAVPVTLVKAERGAKCRGEWGELQQVGQQILIGDEFYSSDGGKTFVEPKQLTEKLPELSMYRDQRFFLSSNTLIVQAWENSFSQIEASFSFSSSDGGMNWKLIPYLHIIK